MTAWNVAPKVVSITVPAHKSG